MDRKTIYGIALGIVLFLGGPLYAQSPDPSPSPTPTPIPLKLHKIPTYKNMPPSVRIKDIAQIQGVRYNQLTGFGLVTGLSGTGDSSSIGFTVQALVNMMEGQGFENLRGNVKAKNVAVVAVTAQLPPFVKPGQPIDVVLSSI